MTRSAVRNEKLDIRLSADDKERLGAAAAVARRSLSDFVLSSALASAEETLADRRHFVLDPDRWEAFLAILDRPPAVSEGLSKLMRRPSPFESGAGD